MSNKFGVRGVLDKWKKGDLPGNEMVNITLDEYSTDGGVISLTAQLATDGEIDYAVDQIIKDLEKTRKKAKEKLRKNNEKIELSLK